MTYSDTVEMTPEELHKHPEVELCECAHVRKLHTEYWEFKCRGVSRPCECAGFRATGQRSKNSLISLPTRPGSLDDYGQCRKLVEEFRAPDISDLIANIVNRHAGELSRRALAEDLLALVNAEQERCAIVAESTRGWGDASAAIAKEIRRIQ